MSLAAPYEEETKFKFFKSVSDHTLFKNAEGAGEKTQKNWKSYATIDDLCNFQQIQKPLAPITGLAGVSLLVLTVGSTTVFVISQEVIALAISNQNSLKFADWKLKT